MADNNVGSSVEQIALMLKPKLTRAVTDKFLIPVFPITFTIWLAIGLYETEHDDDDSASGGRKRLLNHYEILSKRLLNLTIYGVVSAVLMIPLLVLISKSAKLAVTAAKSVIIIATLSLIFLIPFELLILYHYAMKSYSLIFIIVVFILTIMGIIYQVTTFISIRETNVFVSEELLAKSCIAIVHSLIALLFSLAVGFLSLIVLMYTISIFLDKARVYGFDENLSVIKYFDFLRISVFFISGIYIFNFVWNFGLIVIGDHFMNVYLNFNKETTARNYVFQSIKRVVRYHLGTVSFLSIPILPSAFTLIMTFKTNPYGNEKPGYKPLNFFSKISLINNITDYALTYTSIYGFEAMKSMNKLLSLHQKNTILYLTFNAISDNVINIGIVLATIVGLIIRLASTSMSPDALYSEWTYYIYSQSGERIIIFDVFITFIYISYMYKAVFRPATCIYSIYQMTNTTHSYDSPSYIIEHPI